MEGMYGSETWRAPTVSFQITDLVDNECARASHRNTSKMSKCSVNTDLKKSGQVVDWHCEANKHKLKWIRRLTRKLFNAFKSESKEQNLQREQTRWTACAQVIQHNKYFVVVSLFVTFYTLIGPDVFSCVGKKAKHTLELAIVNTCVLSFFVGESFVLLLADRSYLCSPQFLVDTFSMLTMVSDTWIAYQVWKSDGAASGRIAKLFRALRMGGRSSRFIRMFRNMRLIQAIRMMPRIWRVLGSPRRDICTLLFYERLYRIFQALDEGEKGHLSEDEVEIFHMAMAFEFPVGENVTQKEVSEDDAFRPCPSSLSSGSGPGQFVCDIKAAPSISSIHLRAVAARMRRSSSFRRWRPSWWMAIGSHKVAPEPMSGGQKDFETLLRDVEHMPVGKAILAACDKDLGQVEESFSLMHEAGARISLKVSILVLVVLILLPMLEGESQDWSDMQYLLQLDAMHLADAAARCSLVRNAVEKTKNKLILLALNMTIYWTPDCQCCSSCCTTSVESLKSISGVWQDWSGLQAHELQKHCYPGKECNVEPRSLALFDIHEDVRQEAFVSLMYTLSVFVILLAFVLFFTTDLRIFNERVLCPLWDLLDDMAAMRSVEFARGQDLTELGHGVKKSLTSLTGQKHNSFHRIMKFAQGVRSHSPQLAEMVTLEMAVANFRSALRNWAKYVPLHIVRQLVQHDIEVQLGVMRREVTVFFLDIDDFDDLCKDLEPQEVLELFADILQQVTDILETLQGTLLEFIGDEIMAVFNAPTSLRHHAAQAVKAAAECLEHLAKLRGLSLRPRIGVHSANVLAGNLGSPMRLKYGLLGDGVNMTARLKSLNGQLGTRCLVSSTTLELASTDDVVSRPLGRYILKGRTTPTEVWEIYGKESALPESVKLAVLQHEQGFDQFLHRNFEQARSLFAEANQMLEKKGQNLGDKPSQRLLRKCEEFMKSPPSDNWDGSEKLNKK